MSSKEREIRVYEVDGRKCWTTGGASKATGYHRNTFRKWGREELNFPMIVRVCSNGKKRIFIPIDEYLEWLGYRIQN